jgi:uncharacterized membrane protein HdeD (DUF308 family)
MHNNWKEKSMSEKVISISRIAVSVCVIILALLHLLNVCSAIDVVISLVGVNLLLQSIQEWRKDRFTAIFSLCTALFVFAITFLG